MADDLKRASQEDIPNNQRWDISALWALELETVKAWLRYQAGLNYGKTQDEQLALEAGKSLPDQVIALFDQAGVAQNAITTERASLGVIRKEAPSPRVIAVIGVLRWVAMLSEILLFLFMALRGFGSYVLVVFGVLLALCGYMLGDGAGNLMISTESGKGLRSFKGWLYLIIGVIGTAGISYIRSIGLDEGQLAALLVPIIVALTIGLFEAMYLALTFKLDHLQAEMFRAQRWFATDQHRHNYQNGLWKKIYGGDVAQFAKNRAEIAAASEGGAGPKRVTGM